MEIVKEMKKLRDLLDERNIKWEDHSYDIDQSNTHWFCVTRFIFDGTTYSAANGFRTYGGYDLHQNNAGLLELAVLKDNVDVIGGHLTAWQVLLRTGVITPIGVYTICNTGSVSVYNIDDMNEEVLAGLDDKEPSICHITTEYDEHEGEGILGFKLEELFIPFSQVLRYK